MNTQDPTAASNDTPDDVIPTPGVVKAMDHANPNAMQDRTTSSEDGRSPEAEDREVALTRRLIETYIERAAHMLDLGDYQQARADMEQARRLAAESIYPISLDEEIERLRGPRPGPLEA